MIGIRHKFHAIPTVCDGIKFASKKESKYYQTLKAEEGILFFLRQVPFHLPGGVAYRADFVIFHTDGSVRVVDVKGFKTKEYILKKKLVESLYPITIEEV